MRTQFVSLDRATYRSHLLHGEARSWPETNCYVDLWIEALHALGLEPMAAMAFTVAIDYEGDQWTFFKFPLEDLYELFGIDTMELLVRKSLPEAILNQLARGRSVIVELDAFHLPDTAGVSYHLDHVKTSVAVQGIDPEAGWLGYFHNRSYYELTGADYAAVFRLDKVPDPHVLPPYFEVVKFDHLRRLDEAELRRLAWGQLRRHLLRRPANNPVKAFAGDFIRDVAWLRGQPVQEFHSYAFATLRQLGANFECAASFSRWLGGPAAPACEIFERIASTAKAMQFRLARVAAGKAYDPSEALRAVADDWEKGLGLLATAAAVG